MQSSPNTKELFKSNTMLKKLKAFIKVRKPLSLTGKTVMLRGFLCCLAYKPSPLMRIASGKRTLAIRAAPILCCHMLADGCWRRLYTVVCGWLRLAGYGCIQSSAAGCGCLRRTYTKQQPAPRRCKPTTCPAARRCKPTTCPAARRCKNFLFSPKKSANIP